MDEEQAREERRKLAIEELKRCRRDFIYFAEKHLKIRTKDGNIEPLKLNKTQRYVHMRLEKQLHETGKIRALVLKGRQQGVSTYVGARYYHKASLFNSKNVFILSHEMQSTEGLFDMVDRYHKHNPLAPSIGTSNAKELKFDRLDSMYRVATAGDRAAGRSRTMSLFHGSEAALWKNPKEHFAASVQTVPKRPGTEVILESTAKGPTGEFFNKWQDAEAGIGEYIAIFAPWYWEETNVMECPEHFEITDEKDDSGMSDLEYMETYNLSREQMYWRSLTIHELGGRAQFRQEYPANAAEAFISSTEDPFIEPTPVLRARKRKETKGYGPLIIGVDPAGSGGDRFAIAYRRGTVVEKIEWRDKIDEVEAAQWIKSIIDEAHPDRVNIDAGHLGGAIISMVKSFGDKYLEVVTAVNFGGTSQFKMAKKDRPGPRNRRAEMWDRARKWLNLEEGVSIPDLDALQTDFTGVRKKPSLTNDLVLESKDDMKARGLRSPDLADAVVLTFASNQHIEVKSKPQEAPSSFKSGYIPPPAVQADSGESSHTSWMG